MSSIAFLGVASLAGVALCAPSPLGLTEHAPSIQQVATLRAARAAHTATTLPSGQVVFAGGITDGESSLATVELFDPTTNAVRALGALSAARSGHTATLLRDGRVLIAGGYNGEYLASMEILEPATGQFRPAGALTEGRSGHTATLLPDGRVLFIGGVGSGWTFLRSAELYDPQTGRSEAVGALQVPRETHTATLLDDGRVLVVGGHGGRRESIEVHASAEVFSPVSRRFDGAGTMTTARHKHDAVRLPDGRVLIIGGADRTDRVYFASTEIYDPRGATVEHGPSMAHQRVKIANTAVVLANGNVLVSVGAEVAEVLDLGSGTFRDVPGRFPDAFRMAATALLPGGDVLIAGGYTNGIRNTRGIWRFRQR